MRGPRAPRIGPPYVTPILRAGPAVHAGPGVRRLSLIKLSSILAWVSRYYGVAAGLRPPGYVYVQHALLLAGGASPVGLHGGAVRGLRARRNCEPVPHADRRTCEPARIFKNDQAYKLTIYYI
jgi:hypothetical protein